MSASRADIDGTYDEFRYAYMQLSGADSIDAQVLSVDNTDEWAKAGVIGFWVVSTIFIFFSQNFCQNRNCILCFGADPAKR